MNISFSKIGHDSGNQVVQKLTLEKNVLHKNWSSKLKFTNEKTTTKFRRFLIDFKSTTVALFVELSFIDRIFLFFLL